VRAEGSRPQAEESWSLMHLHKQRLFQKTTVACFQDTCCLQHAAGGERQGDSDETAAVRCGSPGCVAAPEESG